MEKTITLSTDHDAALLAALSTFARKNEAETAKLEQEKRTLEAQEAYYLALAKLKEIELRENEDPETVTNRTHNNRLRSRRDNRELMREMSTQGRREQRKDPSGGMKNGTKPVEAAPAPSKPEGLTHHIVVPEALKQEVRAA